VTSCPVTYTASFLQPVTHCGSMLQVAGAVAASGGFWHHRKGWFGGGIRGASGHSGRAGGARTLQHHGDSPPPSVLSNPQVVMSGISPSTFTTPLLVLWLKLLPPALPPLCLLPSSCDVFNPPHPPPSARKTPCTFLANPSERRATH